MVSAFFSLTRLRQVLLVVVGGVLLAVLAFEGRDTGFLPTAVGTVVTGALCVAALAVPRELLPRCAAFAVTASAALSIVSFNLSQRPEHTPGLLELCALLALVARAVRHLRPVKAELLVTAAGLAVALIPLRLSKLTAEHLNLLETALFFCVLAAIPAGLHLRLRDRLRARERESIREAQRLEYARDLHDFVAHHVTAIVARTRAARFAAGQGREQDPEDLDRMLADIENAASQSLSSMRGMVSVLRTSTPPTAPHGQEQELAQVLKSAVEEFSAAGPPPAAVDVDPRVSERRLPPGLVDVVRGVVREALTNARRYAPAASCVIVAASPQPGSPERLELSVTDDGGGPSVACPGGTSDGASCELIPTGGGFGLKGLAERVEAAGGRFSAGPRTEAVPDPVPGPDAHTDADMDPGSGTETHPETGPRPDADGDGAPEPGWTVSACLPLPPPR
ncbi:histidine kinase [Streptomyces abyssalis]|uniref:histidine kinase n=1 Tax=Streptomyces abyssalis TaxID=933944 RepID=UPI00085C685E|nr:histidine kinase [Streptomyces abyssalis]